MKGTITPGDRFGSLVAVSPQRTQNRPGHLCQCDCGSEPKAYRNCDLQSGNSKSCGCLRVTVGRQRGSNSRKHGLYDSRVYHIWEMMKQRCLNPSAVGYHRYGGRGITVCERWMVFDNFYADMGDPPSDSHTLDRKENDGHYEPGNCRWATAQEQADNRPSTKRFLFNGEQKTARELAAIAGLNLNTFKTRLKAGWSIDRIMSTKGRTTA